MKIYCSCCDKVQPVRIDNCRDAKTNEPYQDIVCAKCDLVIASGTGIAQPEQEQNSTCNNTLRAEGKVYPRTCKKCGKGPCIADRVQPEQEPVWIQPHHLQKARQAPFLCRVEPKQRDDFVPLYTTPRQWQGLTDDEIVLICGECAASHADDISYARAIEAKLREKNT